MTNIIKRIRTIMGEHESSEISFKIFSDNSFAFYIYQTEIPIIVDLKNEYSYVDCECENSHLTKDMLFELHKICEMLDKNIGVIKEVISLDR